MNKVTEKIKELEAAAKELRDTSECLADAIEAVQRATVAFSKVSVETVASIKEYNDERYQELQKLNKAMVARVESEQPVQGESK